MTRPTDIRPARLAAACALALGLAGCAGLQNPAGFATGGFGDATAINHRLLQGQGALLVLNDQFRARVDDMVTFDFDSAALTPAAMATLDRQAAYMRGVPELAFSLYGHADAPGSSAYNRRLGERRARAVLDYLVSRGIGRARLEALVSFGETRPAVATGGRERMNRRVVTQVSGFGHPGNPTPLNGKYAATVFSEYVASAVPQPAESQDASTEIEFAE